MDEEKHVCENCNGNSDDYYGEGYPCDQCEHGWVCRNKSKEAVKKIKDRFSGTTGRLK